VRPGRAHHPGAGFASRDQAAGGLAHRRRQRHQQRPPYDADSGHALATAHLGIEESEYDKPTYLRRAMAGEGMRLPGDGKS
jgi:hypothetical protein